MNILYVSDSPTVSGAEIVLLQYVERIRPPEHQTHVFLKRSNHRLIEALGRRGIPYSASNSFSRVLIETTLNPHSLYHFGAAFWCVARELSAIIRDRRIDIVHSISYPAALYSAFAVQLTRKPHIWHEHGIKRVHAVNRWLFRFVASSSVWVIGPSKAVMAPFVAAGIDRAKIRTVYNGIDLERFRINDDAARSVRQDLRMHSDCKAVGLFGQMLPHKGHKTLIEAAPQILARYPDAHFYFIGALENPPYQRQLDLAIRERGLGDKFMFTGWCDNVPDVIRAMDVVVVATVTPEPAALALMETMAAGRPVVASNTGGTPEIVRHGETGLLYEAGNPVELADRIMEVLGDASLSMRLGTTGRRVVEVEFGLQRHLSAILDLYRTAPAANGALKTLYRGAFG